MPDIFNKYEAVIIQSNNSTEKFIQKYIDMDGDNYAEKVILHNDVESIPPLSHVSVYSSNNVPYFDISLKRPWIDLSNLYYADIDKNGKKQQPIMFEVSCFTLSSYSGDNAERPWLGLILKMNRSI